MTTKTIHIDPDGIYDDDLLYGALEVSRQTLTRARRDGTLRYTRKGKRVFYMGKWVLDWLSVDCHQVARHPAD